MNNLSLDFRILEITRQNILKLIDQYTIEELNRIPEGFNNNLMWNFAHVIVTQQLLCYGLSKLDMYCPQEMISAYKIGTAPDPDRPVSKEELDSFKMMFHKNIQLIESDYKAGKFQEFKVYTTSYNMTLNNIEEAIRFNNVHESMHLGTCLALQKCL